MNEQTLSTIDRSLLTAINNCLKIYKSTGNRDYSIIAHALNSYRHTINKDYDLLIRKVTK